ncbi:hypothetical protein BC628DRAFT_40479 [Trametes gibbosa]|nr:hypothetical protein BC628DRAFT_40479 [Trametes gibbosa]
MVAAGEGCGERECAWAARDGGSAMAGDGQLLSSGRAWTASGVPRRSEKAPSLAKRNFRSRDSFPRCPLHVRTRQPITAHPHSVRIRQAVGPTHVLTPAQALPSASSRSPARSPVQSLARRPHTFVVSPDLQDQDGITRHRRPISISLDSPYPPRRRPLEPTLSHLLWTRFRAAQRCTRASSPWKSSSESISFLGPPRWCVHSVKCQGFCQGRIPEISSSLVQSHRDRNVQVLLSLESDVAAHSDTSLSFAAIMMYVKLRGCETANQLSSCHIARKAKSSSWLTPYSSAANAAAHVP